MPYQCFSNTITAKYCTKIITTKDEKRALIESGFTIIKLTVNNTVVKTIFPVSPQYIARTIDCTFLAPAYLYACRVNQAWGEI